MTITVIGALQRQTHFLTERCKDLPVRLRFIDKSRRGRPGIPTSDFVVVWFSKSPHVWTRTAYRTHPRSRVRLLSGGLSGLLRLIRALALGGK